MYFVTLNVITKLNIFKHVFKNILCWDKIILCRNVKYVRFPSHFAGGLSNFMGTFTQYVNENAYNMKRKL
jgi:hypothetical protein